MVVEYHIARPRVTPLLPASHEAGWRRRRRGGVVCKPQDHPVTLRVPPLLEEEGNLLLPASHEAGWRRRRRGGVVCTACSMSPFERAR